MYKGALQKVGRSKLLGDHVAGRDNRDSEEKAAKAKEGKSRIKGTRRKCYKPKEGG